ncbi:twin-arginine translocase TatA [Rickettsia prowazekii]|uniref:Sec-independent protein translocase protein TatA n=2 Tax=Rickettsia prowazekii TaxID=782 RepID=TATA_RICPR|nr:Sec-independent protein translocase subunit TatA [Rickettsia prowazekii]Q9ZCJ1.1 RecName: Full=Sec-independent protein translocase protein TatA [Rickettsia prowazekii str. Madrid E]EOB10330.1 Phosphatidylglycerophosphatase [Rickettsia prowazekii str. GvF12]ADE30306.1 Twin-arginine translocation protein TatA [Rickettsia prowazekii str. Rp22]AFE49545.1 twin arginine translocase protein A [Rickettsia prowazekii str. Chernikova]AFE50389.1 twin arginine translocase protein A [Rickettsia prowazek
MGMSFSHLLIVLLIIFVLFGAGKLPQVMSDLAKGLKAFKEGMKDDGNDNDKTNN